MPPDDDLYRARRGPATCDEVGFRRGGRLDQVVGNCFRRAYDAAGGEAVVGCPREDDPSGFVGRWGLGWRQDLRGGSDGEARLMATDRDATVVVMSGRWHREYTDGSGFRPNSGAVLGYPVTDPAPFAGCPVVRLTGGGRPRPPGLRSGQTKSPAAPRRPGCATASPSAPRSPWPAR